MRARAYDAHMGLWDMLKRDRYEPINMEALNARIPAAPRMDTAEAALVALCEWHHARKETLELGAGELIHFRPGRRRPEGGYEGVHALWKDDAHTTYDLHVSQHARNHHDGAQLEMSFAGSSVADGTADLHFGPEGEIEVVASTGAFARDPQRLQQLLGVVQELQEHGQTIEMRDVSIGSDAAGPARPQLERLDMSDALDDAHGQGHEGAALGL
jgi:hypothetical protein